MSKQIFLIILVIAIGLAYLGLGEHAVAMDSRTLESDSTCSSPTPERSLECHEMEQEILAATLRIEIRTWIVYVEGEGYMSYAGDGHGTVMGGRYLVTHNHFQLPLLELLADQSKSEQATVTLYTSDGQELWQGPLTAMDVAFEDSESLLLEFQDKNGRGLFEALGIPSAGFVVSSQTSIRPGTEVAQINWDEERAYVQWTNVENIAEEGNTPVIRLSDCLVPGSSGGGIFWDGEHIANNWSRAYACAGATNDHVQFGSTAALNSVELLAAVR